MIAKGVVGIVALLLLALGARAILNAPRLTSLPAVSVSTTKELVATSTIPLSAASQIFFQLPISNARARVTKKPFGLYVSPQTSPVKPERFQGYHTGVDFEVDQTEQAREVTISAICDGEVQEKRWISGYGGVLVQACAWQGKPVTVLYGHLNVASINVTQGASLSAGERIGVLGKGFSQETDGERKHLHLAIHRGMTVDVKGYVKTKGELSGWMNALEVLP